MYSNFVSPLRVGSSVKLLRAKDLEHKVLDKVEYSGSGFGLKHANKHWKYDVLFEKI